MARGGREFDDGAFDDGPFDETLSRFEHVMRESLGDSTRQPPATSADIARVAAIYGHTLPPQVEALYRRSNGGLLTPNGGWQAPLPTTRREAVEIATWAASAPFGFRDHVQVFQFDHACFSVALGAANRGEVWRIEVDVDPDPVVRVADDLDALLDGWLTLIDDGALIAGEGRIGADLGIADPTPRCRRLHEHYGDTLSPYLYWPYLSSYSDPHIVRPLIAACGAAAVNTLEDRERLEVEIEAFLDANGEGRVVDPEPRS